MATTTKHSAQCGVHHHHDDDHAIGDHAREIGRGSTPTRASNLAYGTPRPPQASAGGSGGGRGALVPGGLVQGQIERKLKPATTSVPCRFHPPPA